MDSSILHKLLKWIRKLSIVRPSIPVSDDKLGKSKDDIMQEFIDSIIYEGIEDVEMEDEHPDELDDEYDDYDEKYNDNDLDYLTDSARSDKMSSKWSRLILEIRKLWKSG